MSINLKEIRELLYLHPNSADIYVELLTQGELTGTQIKDILNKSEIAVNDGLIELKEKGLIMEVTDTERNTVYQTASLMQLEEMVEREREIINHLKKFVLPQVQEPHKLGIIKYEGIEGIRKAYLEILEEGIKTNNDIYAFEHNIANSDIGATFFENYVQQRIEHQIQAYVICPPNTEDLNYQKKWEGEFTNVRLIEDFQPDANINIVGDLVMSFSLIPAQGTLRRNRAEANTWRSVFKTLWEKI